MIILYSEAIAYTIIVTGICINILKRYLLKVCINKNWFKAYNFINKEIINVSFTSIFAIIYLVFGIYNINNIDIKNYSINLNNSGKTIRLAFVSDMHVGSGMHQRDLELMSDIINNCNVEALLIAGDIVDSSTNISDINNLNRCLETLKMPIYYCVGNHEQDCIYDYEAMLDSNGVNIINDKVVNLDDTLVMVGRDLNLEESIEEILDNEISDEKSYIILQHDPSKLNQIDINNSLILSGHTHGYQFPFMNPSAVAFKFEYGLNHVNQSDIIVSCGLSVWGHHTTFPSKNEIIILEVNY